MRILIVHNRYRSESPSGENEVVDEEAQALSRRGISVMLHTEDSDGIDRSYMQLARAAAGPIYSQASVSTVTKLLRRFQPDVLHLHNPFPLISPYIVRLSHRFDIPVVQTVHNYRHSCVNGLHFRNGKQCFECVGKLVELPALRHGCYRGSRVQTIPMVASQLVHRGTWRQVDRYIALTSYMAQTLLSTGISESAIRLRPSWTHDRGRQFDPGKSLLYLGRLDQAKGVNLLLDAWSRKKRCDIRLVIAGSGPMKGAVDAAAACDESIDVLGQVPKGEVQRLLDGCSALVVPSLWLEGLPLTIVEAFERGRAVISTAGTSAATAIPAGAGWLVPASTTAFAEAFDKWNFPSALELGREARVTYEKIHTEEIAMRSLIAIYEEVAALRHKDDRR